MRADFEIFTLVQKGNDTCKFIDTCEAFLYNIVHTGKGEHHWTQGGESTCCRAISNSDIVRRVQGMHMQQNCSLPHTIRSVM